MWLDEITGDDREAKITSTETDASKYTPALNNNEFANNQTTVNEIEWFTLSNDEWNHLLNRTDADENKKYGVATVYGVNGLIFLPDDWEDPDGVKKIERGVADNYGAEYATKNDYTADDWAKLEKNGAVFLPACGYRYGTGVYVVAEYGYYWSSTACDSDRAYFLDFGSDDAGWDRYYHYWGFAVRLVRVLQN